MAHLEVQVGSGRVARRAHLAQHGAAADALACLHPQGIALEVAVVGLLAVVVVDADVVAEAAAASAGAGGAAVGAAVLHGSDGAVGAGDDVTAAGVHDLEAADADVGAAMTVVGVGAAGEVLHGGAAVVVAVGGDIGDRARRRGHDGPRVVLGPGRACTDDDGDGDGDDDGERGLHQRHQRTAFTTTG